MSEKKYNITLSDGTKLTDLKQNGNYFISSSPIRSEMFYHNLSVVTIDDGETTETFENMELIHSMKMGNGWGFALAEIPQTRLSIMKLQSRLDYVEMMAEIV